MYDYDKKESIMENLSFAESLMMKCDRSENVFKSLNIYTEVLNEFNDNNNDNDLELSHIAFSKICDCFFKVDNKTKICLVHLIKKFKKVFEYNLYIKMRIPELIRDCINMLKCSDPIARRCVLQFIKEMEYIVNLELLHGIFDLYCKEDIVSIDEKNEIKEILKLLIKANGKFKKNVLGFIERIKITL